MANFQEMAKEVKRELETKCGFNFNDWLITFELNNRFRTTLGDCTREYISKTAKIRIHGEMFTQGHYFEVKQTIAHELCHVIQEGGGHGESFKCLASVVNQNTNYVITRTSHNPAAKHTGVYKYKIICEKCGATSLRQRATAITKNPENYRCTCGGKLKIEKI